MLNIAKKVEKYEKLVESNLLEFQKGWNVFLKGAEALWSQRVQTREETYKKDWQLEDAVLSCWNPGWSSEGENKIVE